MQTLIEASELARQLHRPDWVIADCRFSLADSSQGYRDYLASHIPGAVYCHLDNDLSGPVITGTTGRHPLPDVNFLADRFSSWGISNGIQVIAYDDLGGSIAARLWWLLLWLGHDQVAVLNGGWQGWLHLQGETHSGAESNTRRQFVPQLRADMVMTTDQIAALLTDPSLTLLDARETERYLGVVEPIDPIAGHIPGARSVPWRGNVDEHMRFLTPTQLQERYREILGDTPTPYVACYCGSGVTACHNILAMTSAGWDHALLYAGSWSEWITSDTRPISTRGTSASDATA